MIPLLWRRGGLVRLAFGVVALALGGAAVLGTQLTASALQRQSASAVRARAGSAEYDIEVFEASGFSPAQVAAVARLKVVSEASALEQKADLAQLPSGGFRQVVLVASGAHGVALRPLPLVVGRAPVGLRQVAVSQSLAPGISIASGVKTPGRVGLGQRLSLLQSKASGRFRVVGVVADSGPGAPFTEDAVYVSQRAAESLFSSGLKATDVAVRLRPGTTREELLAELSKTVHTQYTVSDPRSLPEGDPASELRPILDAVTALSLVLAFVVIATTLSSVVGERRREIGLLRLAGATPSLVVRSFLREALVASCLGAALGVGAGYLLAEILIAVSTPAGSGAAVLPDLRWSIATALLVVLVGTAAGLWPAYQAASVTPLEATHAAPPGGHRAWLLQIPLLLVGGALAYLGFSAGGGVGAGLGAVGAYLAIGSALSWFGPALVAALGGLLAPLLRTPAPAMAIRSRSGPSGTWLAVVAIFVGVATATGLAGLTSSALASGQVWVDHLFVGQYLLVSPSPQSNLVEGQLLSSLRQRLGRGSLVAVAPVRFLDSRVGHEALPLAATSLAAYARSGALDFVQGQRQEALASAARGRSVLIPLEVAEVLHARVGERLKLVAGTGSASFRVAGIVRHTLPGPSGEESLVIEQREAVKAFGSSASGFDLVQLKLRSHRDPAAATALSAFRYGLEAESVATVRQGVDQGVEHDVAALSALALLGVVIAILAAANTLFLGARSGIRQMALLRVLGVSRGQVSRAVVGQALATALVGSVLGAGVGIGLIAPEVRAAGSEALPLPFLVPTGVVLVLLAAVLAAILIAALAPARQLANLDPTVALAPE